MNDVELLYIKFIKHPFLSGLEVNFSQDYEIECNDNKNIYINSIKNHNIFDNNITNLNVLIGKNGFGKTTIMNTIFKDIGSKLSDTDNNDKIIVLRKYKDKSNYEINIYTIHKEMKYICCSENKKINIKMNYDDFTLDIIPKEKRKKGYIQETYNRIYISDFIDNSINISSSIMEDDCSLNYSPEHLIRFPNEFLSTISTRDIANTMNSFKIISKIHEINFLNDVKSEYVNNLKKPDLVQLSFRMVSNKLIRYIKENRETDLNKIYISLKKQGKDDIYILWYEYLFSAVMCILDLSNYAQYDAKLLKREEYKNFKDEEIREFKNKHINAFKLAVEDMIKKEFIEISISISNFEKSIESIINKFKIGDFYVELSCKDDEDYFLMKEKIREIFKAYREIIETSCNNCTYKLDLSEGAKFLKNYLTLTNRINNKRYYLSNELLPDSVEYLKNNNIFYFSSGESALIKYYTYINLGVDKIKEKNSDNVLINLLMDEPTNSMHPEMQKHFIKSLTDYLQNLGNIKNCRFNVLITTHSPIITSELTSNHVIYLRRATDIKSGAMSLKDTEKPKTFAQNIYTLYSKTFDVEEGMIGTFADKLLMEIYNTININKQISNEERRFSDDEVEFLIEEIGEPILRNKFIQCYNNKVYTLINSVKDCKELDETTQSMIIELLNKNKR
ncbi:MAG: hypothetical protein E6845_01265 [Clostridium sp.]|uniref:hypothetical protein n=1 Tax=Clostridium sp. TaxID=1506 RepID=UPI0029050A9B|nr:hypothetical protein [Clostridium sp.]MDU1601563.1 hypothetical protein [Clostridium sp.]